MKILVGMPECYTERTRMKLHAIRDNSRQSYCGYRNCGSDDEIELEALLQCRWACKRCVHILHKLINAGIIEARQRTDEEGMTQRDDKITLHDLAREKLGSSLVDSIDTMKVGVTDTDGD